MPEREMVIRKEKSWLQPKIQEDKTDHKTAEVAARESLVGGVMPRIPADALRAESGMAKAEVKVQALTGRVEVLVKEVKEKD